MSFLSNFFKPKEASKQIKVLDVDVYKKAIEAEENLQLVDVRTKTEYNGGHINNAQQIDYFQQSAFKKAFEKFDKEAPLYLYCRSGQRSLQAAKILDAMGFKEIYDLKGGYLAWKKVIQ